LEIQFYKVLKTIIKIFILVSVASILIVSCREKQEFPPEPRIEFLSFTKLVHPSGYDTLGVLLISYTDGDGDLGLQRGDKTPYNFFVSYFVMKNGVLQPGTFFNTLTGKIDTINFNNRFGPLAPEGYKGWIKGEIEDTIKPLYDPRSTKEFDTVQFKVFLTDRAGNISNTVETPLIIVKNP
jgi:hypothetical protein